MILRQTVPPAALPLTLDEVKEHLRVETNEEDVLISSYIAAVTSHLDGADGILQRCLVPQEWTVDYAGNCGCALEIPLPPLIAVNSVSFVASDGTETPADPAAYTVIGAGGSMPAKIAPAGGSWGYSGALRITYEAGYETEIPQAILQYMRMVIADAHQNRQTIFQSTVNRIDLADTFLNHFKVTVTA